MTSDELFIELVHRLRFYTDAMLLFGMLKEHADVHEFDSTRAKISRRQMDNAVTDREVRRSLERLQERGLVTVRTHANTRTYIRVDRQAVFDLLRQPLSPRLPGRQDFQFPFLDAWATETAAAKAASGESVEDLVTGSSEAQTATHSSS